VWSDLWVIDEAPEAIDDLRVQLENRDIHLRWTEPHDDVGVSYYVMYRSINVDSLGDSLASTIDTVYIDTSAAGDAITHYFYVVKAVDTAGNRSEESNKIGEFDIVLMNGEIRK